jgi:hypothetical protein
MATAAMEHLIPRAFRHDEPHSSHDQSDQDKDTRAHDTAGPQTERQVDPAQREEERRSLAHWDKNQEPLSPEALTKRPENKHVGHSAGSLRIDDFELLKTLGTGESIGALTRRSETY